MIIVTIMIDYDYYWWWPTPVFYNEAACGFPGIEARILEPLAAWKILEENLNPNNQRVNWNVKAFLTWQSGQHNQSHRERSIGCKRWRLWAMASWSSWLSRSWSRSWWVVASSRQQNFTEKQYYFKQLIDNWRTVLMIHRFPSLAVPMILVRKVKRSQEQHLCTYFDFKQTSPIGLDSSVTANCAQVSWSTTRTAWTLLQGQSFELNLYSNLLCLCSGW